MLIKIIIAIFIFTSTIFGQVISTTKIYKAQGIGLGDTRVEAINEAIIEALGKINGVRINKKAILNNLEIENENGEKLNLKYNTIINKFTKGKADKYEIIKENKTKDNLYKVIVLVTNKKVFKNYTTPGLDNKKRRSIVIVPANLKKESFNILNEKRSSVAININLSQELLNSITKTRKFNVLDREENRAFYNEQNVFKAESSNKDEALKLSQILGADYLLLTSIKDFIIEKKKINKYISTNTSYSYITSVTVQFKVLTTSTRQVKLANTRTYKFEVKGNSNKEIYYNVLKEISNNISRELIENIYPIRIIEVKNKEVKINQGNIKVGSTYTVYKLGNTLTDTYTKESLGRNEIKIGKIKIIRTLPKYSIAKILEGKATNNSIIRSLYIKESNINSIIHEKIGSESDVKVKENGGVILPFD